MKIFFITGNKNKLEEARAIIPEIEELKIELTEIQETDSKKIIEYKLQEAAKQTKENIIVEDSSVNLECLGGLPGPLIKWFEKSIGNDGLVKIANNFGNNKAQASVWIGFRDSSGKIEYFNGTVKGQIVEPRGENGFGWDKIFEPEGYDKTFGEMTSEEKNKISMRKIALEKLKEYLNKL